MNNNLKIFRFLTPFWKAILLSIILTFCYVLFNNFSLWISVDFIRELFDPVNVHTQQSQVIKEENNKQKDKVSELLDLQSDTRIYKKINKSIKKLIIRKNRYDTIKIVCLLIFLSFLFKNIFLYTRRVIINYIELNIIINIRAKLHSSLLHLPLRYFDKHNTGKLTSIVFNDVNALNVVLSNSFGKMILTPIQVLANLAILFMISWKLSLITFTIVPISGFIIVKIGQSIRRKGRRVFKQMSNVFSTFQETVSSVRIVKAFTNENPECTRFENTNKEYLKKQFRANKLSFATSPINETLQILILVFLLWYGGNLVYSNAGLSAEDFIRFLLFLFTMFHPLKELSGINNIIQIGLAAAERIFSIIDEPPEIYEKPNSVYLPELKESIKFENVSFRYDENGPWIVNDINLNINKGEMVAFVGHSGAGKTTLVNLLPRFYEITDGNITIDGMDIRDATLHSLRQKMSIVTQEIILFDDSVRMNIAYGSKNVNEQDVIDAAKAANAWEFIEKMEKGLDTQIGEKGTRLSGGQKQRLSIARAILKNPSILILDEATSSLDTKSERLVQQAVDNLLKSRTVLVIAHRLSTIRNATKIVVLHNGKIEGIGPHNVLINRSPVYKNLYENQLLAQPADKN